MKKFMTLTLGLAALAFGVFLSVGMNSANAQTPATSNTQLGGEACTPASDITVTNYDINYGTASATDFVDGTTNTAGTEEVAGGDLFVSLVDNCGTEDYQLNMTFTAMSGSDNPSNTIPNTAHDIQSSGASSVNGNLINEVTAPSGPFAGNDNPAVVLTRTSTGGAVGEIDLDLNHDLDIPADTSFDSLYQGDWVIEIQLGN